MLTYEQALRKMAELMKKRHDLCGGDLICPTTDEYKAADREVKRFGDQLAAMPWIADRLVPWMVDVKGTGACSAEMSEELVGDALGHGIDRLNDVIASRSDIAKTIRNFVEENGFRISDSGFGACCWHIGVPCNNSDANRLCALLHMGFAKQITASLIVIEKHFWGWRLPELYNINKLEEYLASLEDG